MSRTSEYHSIDRMSYSRVALYNKDRIKYYKRYILKEEENDDNVDIRMGNLVDALKTDEENFNNNFLITKANKPTGQLLTFTQLMFKYRNEEISEVELLSKCYEILKEENGGKLQKLLGTFITNFENEAREYYNELISSEGKTIITQEEYDLAKEIVKKIDECKAFKQKGEIFSKFVIFFKYNGIDHKSEIDEFIIDHDNKIIYPFDYKCTNFVETFEWDCFLKRNYYIQSSLYKYALQIWAKESYPGYKVENMAFKVVDVTNTYSPLLYKTTDAHFQQGFTGFYVGNKYYKGIDQLLTEIELSTENNNWGISNYNYNNNGIVFISTYKTEKEAN